MAQCRNKKALYEKYMSDDCVVDASSGEDILKNTSGRKLYPLGPEVLVDWLKFLNTLDFHDITIHDISMINSSMIATVFYIMTFKATGEKISEIVFYSGNFEAFDDVVMAQDHHRVREGVLCGAFIFPLWTIFLEERENGDYLTFSIQHVCTFLMCMFLTGGSISDRHDDVHVKWHLFQCRAI